MEFTLFEIHLDDAEFVANAPFSAAESTADEERTTGGFLSGGATDDEDDEGGGVTDGGGGPSPLRALLGLALLVAVALALRRLVGGEPEPLPE